MEKRIKSVIGLLVGLNLSLQAEIYLVRNVSELMAVPKVLKAGDVVTLEDGVYSAVNRTFEGEGTKESPVRVVAAHPGKVFFKGPTQWVLRGKFLELSGFSFDGDGENDGPLYDSGAIRFSRESSDCRITNSLFRNFDTKAAPGAAWVTMEGFRHTVDYCSFEGKRSEKPVIVTRALEEEPKEPRQHRIRFNYFGSRTKIGENGFETIRIGDSKTQNLNMGCVVEGNYFFRAIYGDEKGEPEVISNKSQNNVYRYNTFRENKGQICLRHGDGCLVERNAFFGITGPGAESSGGVRVIGTGHQVRDNYFQDIGGSRFTAAITVMAGESGWKPERITSDYEPADGAKIIGNVLVNCFQPFNLGFANPRLKSPVVPKGVELVRNRVQSDAKGDAVIHLENGIEVRWEGNQFFHPDENKYGVKGLMGVSYGTTPGWVFDSGRGRYVAPGKDKFPEPIILNESLVGPDFDYRPNGVSGKRVKVVEIPALVP